MAAYAVAAAIVIAGAASAYTTNASGRKQAHAVTEAAQMETEAMDREAARQEKIRAEAKAEAEKQAKELADAEAAAASAAAAKEAKADKIRSDALERQRTGRRALLQSEPSTWYTEPTVGRKTLLGA